jgi:hypothetical protein
MKFLTATFKIIFALIRTVVAITLGSIAGATLGKMVLARMRGEPLPELDFIQHSEDGQTTIALRVPPNHLYPGIITGALLRPNGVWAFLGSFLASLLMDEEEFSREMMVEEFDLEE